MRRIGLLDIMFTATLGRTRGGGTWICGQLPDWAKILSGVNDSETGYRLKREFETRFVPRT